MEHQTVRGTGVVAGYAYAPVAWTRPAPVPPASAAVVAEDAREAEVARFKAAVETVATRFADRASAATGVAAEVLGATAALARDRGWSRAAIRLINSGTAAEGATTAAIEQFVAQFEKLGGLMAERTTDLKDIRNRVVAELMGLPEPGVPQPTSPVILCAEDLAPADTAGLDPALVRALVTRLGGPTSHTAIIARQLGIPCIVAASSLDTVPEGTLVLVDGTSGIITLNPDPASAQALVEEDARLREEIRSWTGPAKTADGVGVHLGVARGAHGLLDLLGQHGEVVARDGPALAGLPDPVDDLGPVERLGHPGALDHGQRRGLHGGEPLAARPALPAPTDGGAVLEGAGVHHAGVLVAAVGAVHGGVLSEGVRPGRWGRAGSSGPRTARASAPPGTGGRGRTPAPRAGRTGSGGPRRSPRGCAARRRAGRPRARWP